MSAMSDAVNNGPRATSAKTAHIEARIKHFEAKAKKAHDQAAVYRRKAKGDGPLAKYRKLQADGMDNVADQYRARANELRADLAKAKADEAARHVRHVKRTVASTAAEGLVPKASARVGQVGQTKAGQVAKPGQPKTGSEPIRRQPRKETCRWWSHDHGRCPRDPHPDSKDQLCDLHHHKRYGVTPTNTPTKGTPAMTAVSGEAVNIEQTRANLDQLKSQVTDLRGSFEGMAGSLASGGLNKLAGEIATADDALNSVESQIAAAETKLAEQEAIAEAAQAAGEMHTDTSFYGA